VCRGTGAAATVSSIDKRLGTRVSKSGKSKALGSEKSNTHAEERTPRPNDPHYRCRPALIGSHNVIGNEGRDKRESDEDETGDELEDM
jgi:hypothetical protein